MRMGGRDEEPFAPYRFVLFGGAICLAILILIARLYYLQVVRGEEFRIKSQSNFVQLHRISHDRGAILDRAGRVLVDNRPAHDIYLTPAFVPDSLRTLRPVGRLLRLSKEETIVLDKRILQAQRQGDDASILIGEMLPRREVDELRELLTEEHLTGIELMPDERCPGCARVYAVPQDFPSTRLVFRRLAEALGTDEDELVDVKKKLRKAHGLDRFLPILVARDVAWDAFVKVDTATSLFELPGVDVRHTQRRRYRYGTMAAHVLGYVNEVSGPELKSLRQDGYGMGDFIGRGGIERTYERELRGIDGVDRVVVDVKGRRMDEKLAATLLGDNRGEPPQPGHTLELSIDAEMQRVAEESFAELEGQAGAVVAVEVKTGFLLAMASLPAYDPNVVSGRITLAQKRQLDTDRLQPWINKAIQQQYPPGSTFKVVTALAGLRTGVIDASRQINCPGWFRLGNHPWRCWLLSGHGRVDLWHAIQKSCDVYFYTVGYEAGIDALAEAALLLGFGSRSGVDLRHEVRGMVADLAYYERRPGGYQKGYVVNNSIGQGDIATTPLQLAMAYAAIANGGTLYAPQLVREIRDHEGNIIHQFEPAVRWRIPFPEGGLQEIRKGLKAVCDKGGTAYGLQWRQTPDGLAKWLRTSGVALAGKTGTAQVVKMGKDIKQLHELDYWDRDHAWFATYAPADDPEVAVAVINEHSGHGGSHAAPIAANVIRAYFERVRAEPLGRGEQHPGRAVDAEPEGALAQVEHQHSRDEAMAETDLHALCALAGTWVPLSGSEP